MFSTSTWCMHSLLLTRSIHQAWSCTITGAQRPQSQQAQTPATQGPLATEDVGCLRSLRTYHAWIIVLVCTCSRGGPQHRNMEATDSFHELEHTTPCPKHTVWPASHRRGTSGSCYKTGGAVNRGDICKKASGRGKQDCT